MIDSLFTAVPRTGTTSIHSALRPHGLHEVKLAGEERGQSFRSEEPLVSFYHASIPALIAKGIITREWLAKRWVFAFIRNPWDRMVSLYHYLFDVLGRFREQYGALSFAEFVQHVTTQPIDPIGAYNCKGLSQTAPQTDWLFDGNQCLVSYVGRFELFGGDCGYLRDKLELKPRFSLMPHVNATSRRPYQEYYTPTLREAVATYYASDLEFGEYAFD